MDFNVTAGDLAITTAPCDVLVLGLGTNWETSEHFVALNSQTENRLKAAIDNGELSTKPMKVTSFLFPAGLKCRQLIVVGLGALEEANAGLLFRAAAAAAKTAAATKNRESMIFCGFSDFFANDVVRQRSAVAGAITGAVGQDIFKTEATLHPLTKITWVGIGSASLDSKSIEQGIVLGRCMNIVKRLVNLPPNYLYPVSFVSEIEKLIQGTDLTLEVWDEKKLEAEGCGALLAVARGSSKAPRLCILKYAGKDTTLSPIALVGKGVTFDSGGYSIKPTDGMLTMKCDMAGAATTFGCMLAASSLQIEQPLVAVMGLVENMVSGDAFRLGDVLTARSGKTIEVHNTDAEGRLVLADALNVALDFQPSRILDFATLTGACCVALGNDVVGVMSNNVAWQEAVLDAAERAGEYAWPLPMFPFYKEQISGKIADIKNVGEGRWGGAITAAKFLEEFVDETPWVHLDIAGPAFFDSAKAWNDAGGTAVMVRTVYELLSAAT